MANYLTAAYNLRIKKLYQIIKEKIEDKLNINFTNNKKILLNFILIYMKGAYKEGIDFAVIDSKARINKYIKPDYKINQKTRLKLLKEFLLRKRMTERVYRVKIENYRDLIKLKKIKFDRQGSQEKQIEKEYMNGINAAINILLINTGREGQARIYKQL